MTIFEAKQSLVQLQKRLAAYDHATSLIYYDGVTAAPKGTAENRAQTLEILSGEQYRLSTGTETVSLLEYLDAHRDELSPIEARQVELLLKDVRMMQKIPEDEYVAFDRLVSEGDDVGHRAKEQSDFELFAPVLEKIFATMKKFAGYCAPEKDAYDFWLDKFEEGLTREKCEAFFATLREHIVPLLRRVMEKPQLSDDVLFGDFPDSEQEALALRLMKTIGLDMDHVGLSTTEHPFTISFGSHFDERITTRYVRDNFASSMYSVIHEGGHALYDTGSDAELAYTVLDGGVSMGIHESQSRFFENILGRSRAFCEYLTPVLKECFPGRLDGLTADGLYRAVNRAQPSLIRTEADELTYCLHVMIRYELEKRVFDGELAVRDLPGEWNRLYREVLGVEVPDDRSGVLQDSHWSGGGMGYFPSYALGSAYGAQFLKNMRRTVDVDGCLRRGDFGPINAWLREKIWRFGAALKPVQILEQAAGESFDPTVFTDYLEEKYTALYGLEEKDGRA